MGFFSSERVFCRSRYGPQIQCFGSNFHGCRQYTFTWKEGNNSPLYKSLGFYGMAMALGLGSLWLSVVVGFSSVGTEHGGPHSGTNDVRNPHIPRDGMTRLAWGLGD